MNSALMMSRLDPITDSFVRVELRSTVAAAERTADLARIWSGTLIFDNVPITGNAPLNPDGSFPVAPPPRVVGGGAAPEPPHPTAPSPPP